MNGSPSQRAGRFAFSALNHLTFYSFVIYFGSGITHKEMGRMDKDKDFWDVLQDFFDASCRWFDKAKSSVSAADSSLFRKMLVDHAGLVCQTLMRLPCIDPVEIGRIKESAKNLVEAMKEFSRKYNLTF
jgi:hypothetical protein